MTPRRLSVAVGAAVTLLLAGCMPDSADDPPGCEVSPDPTAAVCAWGRDYQNQAGKPIVYVRYQRHGEPFFRQSNGYNCNDIADWRGVCSIAVQSSTGFASVNEQSTNS